MWPGRLVGLVSSGKTVHGSMLSYVDVLGRTDEVLPFKILFVASASVTPVKTVFWKTFCMVLNSVTGQRPVSLP
jgi:hypothetical protein